MTVTSEVQLANQKAQAERDTAKANGGNLPAVSNGGALAIPEGRSSLDYYLDTSAKIGLVGRRIDFNGKDARYVCADNDEVLTDAVDYIAIVDQTLVGWIHFNGKGQPPDKIAGLICDGFALPPRESLGSTDPMTWELGLNGKPSDPWLHEVNLVLQAAEDGQLFTFTTTSWSGRAAVENLLRHYARTERAGKDEFPVVRLKVGTKNHSDPRVGMYKVPVFAIVGKTPKGSAARPDTSVQADMDDAIPF